LSLQRYCCHCMQCGETVVCLRTEQTVVFNTWVQAGQIHA